MTAGSGPAVAALCRLGGFVYWRVHSAVAQFADGLSPHGTATAYVGPLILTAGNLYALYTERTYRVHLDLLAEQRWITVLRNKDGRESLYYF